MENNKDICGLNTQFTKAPDNRLVQVPLGLKRPPRKNDDFYEGVVLGLPRLDSEVLGPVLDVPDLPIAFGDLKRLALCLVNGLNHRLDL